VTNVTDLLSVLATPTKGDAPYPSPATNAVDLIKGTADSGADPTLITTKNGTVFPPITADTNPITGEIDPSTGQPIPPPTGFNLAPSALDPAEFEKWSSLYQIEYVFNHGGSGELDIGPGASSPPTTIHVVLSSDKSKVYIMDQLQVSSFASMSDADQSLIAGTSFFTSTLQAQLGFVKKSDADQLFTDALTTAGTSGFSLNSPPSGGLMKVPDDVNVFKQELALLQAKVDAGGVYNQNNIQTQIQAILDRFNNASALGSIPTGFTPTGAFTANADSLDGDQGINRGYKSLMNAENQILQLQNLNKSIATGGTLPSSNQALDAPGLIAEFMLGQKQISDATNVGLTEMINQQNNTLAAYTTMEQLVSQTIATIDPSNNTATATLSTGSLTVQQWQALSMFNSGTAGGAPFNPNPIEKINSVSRPTQDMTAAYNSTEWNQLNTRLQDSVTLIQQGAQIATNNITTKQQEGDQEFALANNALAKANDLMQTIGRGFT
jgi:hypothetical protein